MPSPNATPTPITPPRVPLIDPRTGLIDRAWYLFFLSLNNIASGVVDDGGTGADAISLLASYDQALMSVNQELQTLPPTADLSAELIKQIQEANLVDCCAALVSQFAEMQKQIEALNLLPPPAQGTITAVTATAPVVSSGGIAPDISLAAGYGDTQNPYAAKTANFVLAGPTAGAAAVPTFRALVAADIPALPYGTGTVTSVAALTLGTTGTDLSSTVANSTTTPVITLNVPTASATNRGVLSAADWTTFNNKGSGTVTSVTGTAPVVSSGGATPAISMAAADTSTNGYLTSTDWNTFNNKQPAGTYVTSVTGTAPVVSSGGTTPAISMAAASGSTNGYLTSTDWTTFNNKGSGTVTAVSVVSANGFTGTSSGGATPAITLTTSITGLLKGNGTAISAAVANTDYMGVGAPITKTADFTVANGEIWYINNKSGSTCTVTLPAASSWTGRTLTFKNMQAQTLVSASSNVVPIDSTTAGTAILLAVVGNWATMVSDGTNWVIMQQAANNCLLLE